MSKKIGIDIRMYGTFHGGIGRYESQLIPKIVEKDSSNRYFLFYNKTLTQEDFIYLKGFKNVTLVESKSSHYSLSEQTSFLRLLNKHELDLVHFPNFNVPFFYRRKFITTIHDMVHHKISGAKKSRYFHFLAYKKIMENAAKNSEYIITVSDASKKDIHKILHIPENKIHVVYEAGLLENNVAEDKVSEIRSRYLLGKPYFLFVGVLERKKNLINLTRGLDYFISKYKVDIDLVIVGKTDKHYPEIKHKALDIKNQKHLVFTGEVSDSELSALYKGAYAFVTASLHEGFGLPGVEALNFGLPLLASNIKVFNEIYDNAAVYFDPLSPIDIGEKMHLIVRDGQFYEQIQIKSHQRSLNFSWDKAAQDTLNIYTQALQ